MRVLVIRHHDVDTAGFIAEAFEARGASLDVHLFPDDGPLPGFGGVDHIVVMGSVSSVNDPDPWIAEELAWVRAADRAGVPVLGICFGAQIICAALGGRVEAMGGNEIGWFTVDSADQDAVPAGPWLEFHEDRCLVPAGATVLARNEAAVQAFRIGLALRRPVPPRGRRSPAQALAGLDGRRGRRAGRHRPGPVPGRHHPRGAGRAGPGGPAGRHRAGRPGQLAPWLSGDD